jgi:PAS domain S-box-containing protein
MRRPGARWPGILSKPGIPPFPSCRGRLKTFAVSVAEAYRIGEGGGIVRLLIRGPVTILTKSGEPQCPGRSDAEPSIVEQQRLAALRRYRLLDTPPEERFNDIVAVAARLLNTPIALISLIDERRQWFKASFGLDITETSRDVAFCDEAIRQRETLVVRNASEDPRFAGNPLVAGDPGIRFYAGAPLLTPDGHALGTVCVVDVKEHRDFGAADQATLEALSRLVVDHLELRRQAMLNAELAQRAALRERLLLVTADAPDFHAAIRAACDVLLRHAQGLFCHVFRLAADGKRIQFVGGAERDTPRALHLDQLRGLALRMCGAPVAVALREQHQVVDASPLPLDLRGGPASGLAAAHGMAEVQIVTPLGLQEERYAFALGLRQRPEALDALAEVMADVTSALRPLLRRMHDEEEARLFRRALEATSDPVLITEAEPHEEPGPRIIYANQAFTDVTGYAAAEALGRSPRFLFGPDTAREARVKIGTALRAWRPIRQEITNYRKDGTPHLVELSIAPVADSSGWYTHWISVHRDITEQRQAERLRSQMADELEHLIAGMPGALMRVGKNADGFTTALYASPSIKAITGYGPEEIRPGFMARHLPNADLLNLRACVSHALREGEARLEFQFRHRDGSNRLIASDLRANPTTQGYGEVIMSWNDVTKERLLSAQLAQSAKLAQLGEMATGMAHELNQPLASISLAAENALRSLLGMAGAPPRVQEKLELIIALAQRASNTIDHMRIFGRTGAAPSGPVPLDEMLAGAEGLVKTKLKRGGVSLVRDLPPGVPPVFGKSIPLEQVMINLISNACDAYAAMTPPPPVERRVITISTLAVGDRVRLSVQDHAGGIPDHILPRIFEPFFTTKTSGQGTGLGLSISYGIITDMGGTITAEHAGDGTRFIIDLPAATPPA